MIYGNTEGIKRVVLYQLKDLIGDYDKTAFIDRELLRTLCLTSAKLNRELSAFISRQGRLLAIGIGNNCAVPLADITKRRGDKRLNGVRVIHTHPNGNYHLSDVDISALKANRYDCMASVGITNGRITGLQAGYLSADGVKFLEARGEGWSDDKLMQEILHSETESQKTDRHETYKGRSLLVHVSSDPDAEESLNELGALAKTMGLTPVDTLIQRRDKPDIQYYVGSGKVNEIALLCQVKQIDTLIFDHSLSGAQYRSLSEALHKKILDRSTLILDIFAKHATSNEGKLQVELAKLTYQLPLLVGQWVGFSRQGGGYHAMGGGGETKLEMDRRQTRKKISELKAKLEDLDHNRSGRREQRKNKGVKNVAIVGYTNAGKSTLMNYITKAGVLEENKLFATLDAVSRSVWDNGKQYLLTDTVGFIKRLPHEFIEAFKSTLDEAKYADLLLHVVDCSSPKYADEFDVVCHVLNEIGAGNVPVITVYNKIDLLKEPLSVLPKMTDSVSVSAKSGDGVDKLKAMILTKLFGDESTEVEE